VLTREGEAYRVEVYLPRGGAARGSLHWDAQGRPVLTGDLPPPAHDEALKLARLLRRTPKERLTRWRAL
jgi:hypothetical protein